MKVIVFDAMSVLYRYGNVQGRVLIPYLRAQGCAAPEEEIRAAYRSVTLGRMTTDAFWAALGLTARDEHYCREHELTAGTREALDELAGDGFGSRGPKARPGALRGGARRAGRARRAGAVRGRPAG
ncbi:hypothetical protein [Nonomuraea sp. NPDC003201]